MADTKLPDYPARLGDKQQTIVDHTGPASYVTGGETLGTINNTTGITAQGLSSIDFVDVMDVSVSGTYMIGTQPTGAGSRKTVKMLWFYAGTQGQGVDGVVIATAGTGQTNGTSTVSGVGGGGTGATLSVTIAGGLVTGVAVLNPGKNYTSAPTFTVAQGGTPGTVTATIGTVAGVQVAPGTNLSAETVRIRYQGR